MGFQMKPQLTTRRAPLLAIYAAVVFAFIYLPIVVLILYSFNRDGVGGFPPRHLTLSWYTQLFADSSIWDSVLNSLIVGGASVVLSLTLGLLAALALDRASFPGKALFRRLVLLPLILPGIITGLSLLMFAVFAGVHLSLLIVLIGRDNTLPLEIWGRLRRGITPEINAVSTLIFVVSVGLIIIWYHLRSRSLGAQAREVIEQP